MYEHLERLFQGLAPTSEYLKGVYYELADEFFKQLRQQIGSLKLNCGVRS